MTAEPFRLTAPPLFGVSAESSDEWYTPQWLLAALPPVDLDPCSDPGRETPADRHYVGAEGEDGLALPWSDRVWVNPPYSDLTRWCAKAADHAARNDPAYVIALIPFRPEGFWHGTVWSARWIAHTKRRIVFEHPRGCPSAGAGRFPSALVIWGREASKAKRHLASKLKHVPIQWIAPGR